MIDEQRLKELEGLCKSYLDAKDDPEILFMGGRTEITLAYERAAKSALPGLLVMIRKLQNDLRDIRSKHFNYSGSN